MVFHPRDQMLPENGNTNLEVGPRPELRYSLAFVELGREDIESQLLHTAVTLQRRGRVKFGDSIELFFGLGRLRNRSLYATHLESRCGRYESALL
jgi:hypothetical protein